MINLTNSGENESPLDLTEHVLTNKLIDALASRLGTHPRNIYVVYSPTYKQLLYDKMTKEPVHSLHYKFLEQAAREMKGVVITLEDAVKTLIKGLK